MPDGMNEDELAVFVVGEVDVISGPLHQDSAKARDPLKRIAWRGLRSALEHLEGGDELFVK
jgi:hypothetical protein